MGTRFVRRWISLAAIAATPSLAAAQAPLQGAAGLAIESEPLEEALRLLRRSARVSLVYSPDLIPPEVRVSCACEAVSVSQALDRILAGTGLTYRSTATQILILRTPSSGPQRASGAIAGWVASRDGGRPIANAMVRLESGQGVLTSQTGWFMIRNVPPGTHRVSITSVAWAPQDIGDVEVVAADTVTVTIRLERTVIPLPQILVSPGTFGLLEDLSPGAVRALTREQIQTMPQVGEDVFRSLKRLPGVVAHDISTKLSVRGGLDRELLVRLDGLELYEPYHMKDWDGALGIVDLNALGGVELNGGGFGVEYGDKTAGVLDMRSRTTLGDTKTTLGLSVTNFTLMSRGGFADERGTWLVSARRGFMDLVLKMIGEDERLKPRYYDVFGKVRYQLGSSHVLGANVLRAGDTFGLHPLPSEGDEQFLETGYDSDYVWLGWEARLGPRVSANTTASTGRVTRKRDGYVEDVGRPGMPDRMSVSDDRVFSFAGLRHDLSVELSDRAMLKLGAEVSLGRAEYSYSSEVLSRFLTPEDTVAARVDSMRVDLEPDGHEIASYVAARLRPVDWLTAEVGLRYDWASHTRDGDIAPRLLMALDATPTTSVRASWGRYYQSHGLQELEVGDGQTEFFPAERAQQIALGVEHRFASEVGLRVEAYDRTTGDQRPRFINLEQELVIFPEADGDRIRIDPDRARARGIELLVEQQSGRRWTWSVDYALALVEDRIAGQDGVPCPEQGPCSGRTWVPRLYDQRHAVGLHLTYRPSPTWNLSGAWRYHSGWPATVWRFDLTVLEDGSGFWTRSFGRVRGTRLPAYHRLDLRVTHDFMVGGNTLHAYFDVFNVYNRTNLASYSYAGSYRNGRVFMQRNSGMELLPLLPTLGFRYEF